MNARYAMTPDELAAFRAGKVIGRDEAQREAEAENARLTALVAAMHAAAVGETKTPLLGLVEDVAGTRDAFLAQQHRADTLDGIAREMAKRVAELEDAAYGDATVRLLKPVEQIQHLHASVAAQMSRADTLNRLARQHRARVTELEAALAAAPYHEVWSSELPPGGLVCSICGQPVESEPCPEHAPAEAGERE